MTAVHRVKASDKQAVCKKLATILKKRYKRPPRKNERPTLETILYGICLEDASVKEADACYEELQSRFHDLNEVRVSSISELSEVFDGLPNREARAMQLRQTLQYVFEKQFDFDFELLRRKTFELASKQLARIRGLSPFVRAYTLQAALGGHVIPIDQSMYNAALWLGLIEPDETPESASESLKTVLRKADAPAFCHLLRCLATDSALKGKFASAVAKRPPEGYDLQTAPERLEALLKEAAARKAKTGRRKPVSAKTRSNSRKPAQRATTKTARKKKSPSRTTSKRKTKKKSRASS